MRANDFPVNELKKAYDIWHREFPSRDLDEEVRPFLKLPVPELAWSRRSRNALFLSTGEMAERMGISRSAYVALEAREASGDISIKKLKELAEAMNCDLVYAIRPKVGLAYSEIIWSYLISKSLRHGWLDKCFQKNRAFALAAIAKKNMKKSSFRKDVGWSKRL